MVAGNSSFIPHLSSFKNGRRAGAKSGVAALREFVRPRALVERCDLCGVQIAEGHHHLFEPASRRIACACQPCAILFDHQGAGRYRRVPTRVRELTDFRLDDLQWAALTLPINLVFFVNSSAAGKMLAYYPSPAGATESQLDFETWDEIVRDNPFLAKLEPDVEALLINRIGDARRYYIAPIDECYKLIGLIRSHWRGLSGGVEVWSKIEEFFAALSARAGKSVTNLRT